MPDVISFARGAPSPDLIPVEAVRAATAKALEDDWKTALSYGVGIGGSMLYAAVCTGLVMLIAFLFAPVSARAIAIVGTNPVSGMTMLTLIITGFVLLKLGLSGGNGMFVTMMADEITSNGPGLGVADKLVSDWVHRGYVKDEGSKETEEGPHV